MVLRLEKLLKILQENPTIQLDQILSGPELYQAAFLLTNKILVRRTLRAIRNEQYHDQRFARRLRVTQILAAQLLKRGKFFSPDAGLFRKIHPKKKGIQSRRKLHAFAVTSSTSTSGSLTAQLVDTPVLLRIDLSGTVGTLEFRATFWQLEQQVQHSVEVRQISTEDFDTQVLGQAYTGDLFQLQLENIRVIIASTPDTFEDLPMFPGLNVICTLHLPHGFAAMMPSPLTLYGPFTQERRSRSADLRTAPQFNLQLAHISLTRCYLNIATDLSMETDSEPEYWDTFAYLNGGLEFMGHRLPMASDLSTDSGILSFNLDSSNTPKGAFFPTLEALTMLANSADLVAAWGPGGQAFLQNILECRLSKLNLLYDVGTPGLISMTFQVLCGNSVVLRYDSPKLAVHLEGLRLDWLVGDPGGDKLVTASGSVKSALIQPFDGVEWECSVEPWPEICVRCWAEGSALSEQMVDQWLSNFGGRTQQVANYSGYLFKLYANRVEIFKGDEGEDFPQVL